AKKIVSVAGDHGIPPEDVIIDALAMPVGAEPRAVTLFVETLRLLREELGVNTTCGASNTSFGLPGRHTLGAAFLAVAQSHGLTSAIMDARRDETVEAVRATDSTCGGHGTCKKCKVRVVSGNAEMSSVDPRAFSIDELRNGWRLACRAAAHEDMTIEVPPLQTRPKAALAGVGRHVILRPAVQKRYLELEEPTLEDQASDLERVLAAMDDVELRVPLDLLRGLGGTLRKSDWKVTAVLCDDVLIAVEPGDTTPSRHAIAFDLGTTTVVATLLDLET